MAGRGCRSCDAKTNVAIGMKRLQVVLDRFREPLAQIRIAAGRGLGAQHLSVTARDIREDEILLERGGEALAVIEVDAPLSKETLQSLRSLEQVISAQPIDL